MAQRDHADGWFVIDPETYAKQAVQVIGAGHLSTGCIMHDIQVRKCSLASTLVVHELRELGLYPRFGPAEFPAVTSTIIVNSRFCLLASSVTPTVQFHL